MQNQFKETEIGLIPRDWEVKTLNKICKIIMGQSPPSKTYNEEQVGLPFFQGRTDFGFKYPSINEWCSEPKRTAEKGDILLSVRAPVGDLNLAKETCCIGRGLSALSLKEGNNEFLYYLLSFNKERLKSIFENEGTVFGCVTKKGLNSFDVGIPSTLEEQKKITEVLSDLDSKIELNQRMNQTLEEIGRAIFKHWFVDFEFPDEQGRPHKSSGGEMVDSELGEIPEGWEIKKLGNVCSKVIDGTHDTPEAVSEGYPLVTGKHIVNGFIDFSQCYFISPEEHFKVIKRSKPEKGDIIFSNIGTLGNVTLVDQDFEYSIKNVALFKPLKPFYSSFFYFYFSSKRILTEMENSASGTTQKFFSLKFLRTWELLMPNDDCLFQFNELMEPILHLRTQLYNGNINLSKIRDSLLPKLMSGKIRVKMGGLDEDRKSEN